MARQAAKIGADVRRAFQRLLDLERQLLEAHDEGDKEKHRKALDHLKKVVRLTDRLMRDFLRAVQLPPITASRNPGSEGEDT